MSNHIVGLELLRQPFPEHQISKLPKPTKKDAPKGTCQVCGGWHGLPAVHLDYVGHAALTHRLLDADPQWTWEPLAISPDGLPVLDPFGGMWIKLTVCGVTRLGYGHAGDKQGGDAIKEIIGDALRNAAMRFGAALDLWHKGDLHKDEDEADAKPQTQRDKPKAAVTKTETPMDAGALADWKASIAAASADELHGVKTAALDAATKLKDRDAYASIRAAANKRAAELQGEPA